MREKYPRFVFWYGYYYKFKKVGMDIHIIRDDYKDIVSEKELVLWESGCIKDWSNYEFSPEEAVLMPEFDNVMSL